jgi:hypothetical protein
MLDNDYRCQMNDNEIRTQEECMKMTSCEWDAENEICNAK